MLFYFFYIHSNLTAIYIHDFKFQTHFMNDLENNFTITKIRNRDLSINDHLHVLCFNQDYKNQQMLSSL